MDLLILGVGLVVSQNVKNKDFGFTDTAKLFIVIRLKITSHSGDTLMLAYKLMVISCSKIIFTFFFVLYRVGILVLFEILDKEDRST
jgi:hypothetical protein